MRPAHTDLCVGRFNKMLGSEARAVKELASVKGAM